MKRIASILLLCVMCVCASAQNINLRDSVIVGGEEYVNVVSYMQRVMHFGHAIPQEKVYLHFDNTGYFKGETMWFKAYTVRTDNGTPTDISKVLYVELINPGGEVVKTKKLHLDNGQASGAIELDTLYTTGFYEVRAYTRYMTNWGNAAVFSRVFPIFKQPRAEGDYSRMEIDKFSYRNRQPNYREVTHDILDESAGDANKNQLTMKRLPHGKVHVNFYPEGGNLVEGMVSRVAFTVNDAEGRYFDASGVILDENKEVMRGAVTFMEGKGYFDVKADDEPKYLQLITADGKRQEFELPEAQPDGVVMNLNTLHDKEVTASLNASLALRGRLLGYTLMHEGQIVFCDTMTCVPSMKLTFARNQLPSGVNQLTVFDADGLVLSERLFFICPPVEAGSNVSVTTSQERMVPCGKVTLNIKTKPNASLSFSAVDVATMTNGNEGSMKTWMLLSSELKGYIAHPEYYFESDDREHRIAADMLMMVQGWKRYNWNLMVGQEKFKNIQPIEDKLYIFGHLMHNRREMYGEGVKLKVYLFNKHGQWLYGECMTDSIGGYAFEMPDASGEWNLQMLTRKDDQLTNYRVLIDRNFSPQPRWISPYETEMKKVNDANLFAGTPDSMYVDLDDLPILKRERVLPNVKVTARRNIFEGARRAWESESHGQHWASIYYNVDKEVDILNDHGDVIPGVYEWLYGRNPFFRTHGSQQFIPTHESDNVEKVKAQFSETITVTEYNDPFDSKEFNDAYEKQQEWNREHGSSEMLEMQNPISSSQGSGQNYLYADEVGRALYHYRNPGSYGTSYLSGLVDESQIRKYTKKVDLTPRVYDDGIGYKGRPVVWILNNNYAGITYNGGLHISHMEVLQSSVEDFPTFIDEVKSIYITENVNAFNKYLYCPELYGRSPVTVFLYTHYSYPWKKKGLRKTHFNAFDTVQTFQTDDYSVLPPMEDFRRTLYWAPDVRTDAEGNAVVEFYNNSSARHLYLSVEGMTDDGCMVTNE